MIPASPTPPGAFDAERVLAPARALRAALEQSLLEQPQVLDPLLWAFAAGGHVLLEGAPGLGKTTLARALAAAVGLSFRRVQFTPDLVPADVLGARVVEQDERGNYRFRLEQGPIFAHVLLADEINRASPRTQAALLEAMQEGQVTLHGESLPLPDPFFVIATQNPIEMEGTYPLPEAQLDRFLAKLLVPAPGEEALVRILSAARAPAPRVCMDRAQLGALRAAVEELPASSEIVRLIARLVLATDPARASSPEAIRAALRCGASPRGAQSVLRMAKARALFAGRLHVAEEDVVAVAAPALRHRLVPAFAGSSEDESPDALVALALAAARRSLA